MKDAGPIGFPYTGTNMPVYLGFQPEYIEFELGTVQGTDEDGVYWSWGMGKADATWQNATSIVGKAGVSPTDKTKTYSNRVLVARRKSGGVMTTVLEVSIAGRDANNIYFNVHTAHPTLSPVMKVY